MSEETEITASLLLSLGNWLKPYMELVGENLYLQSFIILLISLRPEPRVRFRSLGDSGLHFELLCWIDEPVLRGRSLDAMNEQVYKRFLSEGIEIPYNKQYLYIKDYTAMKG